MLKAEERRALEEIRRRRRRAKYQAIGFVAVCIVGGIPMNGRPIAMIPIALIAIVIASGFFYSASVIQLVRLFRARCPRCANRFFGRQRGSRYAFGRTLWASRCL